MIYNCIKIDNKRKLRDFINLPRAIYESYPCWISPLNSQIRDKLNPLKNPFFKYGKVIPLGVEDENHMLAGRAAAVINPLYNEIHNSKDGFFGLFECTNIPEAAKELMKSVEIELKKFNCDNIIGPVNFNTNEESGFLIEGYEYSPMFMTNYCPPYYHDLMNLSGFTKLVDMLGYEWDNHYNWPDKFNRIIEILSGNKNIHIRPINMKKLKDESLILLDIYNNSFRDVWGYVPITESESEKMVSDFKLLADDDLILIAEYNKIPVGFCLTLPDVNQILKHLNGRINLFNLYRLITGIKHIRTARVTVLCVLPEYRPLGIAALMIKNLINVGMRKGYKRGELTVVLESNLRMRRLLDTMELRPFKRYRLYNKEIFNT